MRFANRRDAGRHLAVALSHYRHRPDAMVLALPRGGVPVAYEVAKELRLPLDIFVVRKIGMPGHEEYAIGAIASGGLRIVDEDVIRRYNVNRAALAETTAREERELERREQLYRGSRPPLDVTGKTVILVDDGLATGASMRVAVAALREANPARIVVAVPVGAPETCEMLAAEADEVVCVATPRSFEAVGLWYQDFSETSDDEVHELLTSANRSA